MSEVSMFLLYIGILVFAVRIATAGGRRGR